MEGQEYLGALGQAGQRAELAVLRKTKGGRQDAGHEAWRSIEAHGLAGDPRRGAKPPPPKAIGDYGYEVPAGLFFIGEEGPAESRLNAQGLEEIRRHQRRTHQLRVAAGQDSIARCGPAAGPLRGRKPAGPARDKPAA